MFDTIHGEVAVDPNTETYRIKMNMEDMNNETVTITWFGMVLGNEVLFWLFDSDGQVHHEKAIDVISLAVESKHLIDLHINADFHPEMWETYREFLLNKWKDIEEMGGLREVNANIMELMSNG